MCIQASLRISDIFFISILLTNDLAIWRRDMPFWSNGTKTKAN